MLQFRLKEAIMGIKHVRGTTTSLNGCKVEIDGVLYTP